MSQYIVDEVVFLFHSFLLGIVITLVYDGFIILRRLVQHSIFLISLEDMIFWIACAIGVFFMLYEENNGVLRWFAVFGAALGMLAYKKSLSPVLVRFFSWLLARIFHALFRVLRVLLTPVRYFGKKLKQFMGFSSVKGRKGARYIKKKLTNSVKLLKMILCKQ